MLRTLLVGVFLATVTCPARAQEPLFRGLCFGPFRAGEAPGARTPLPSTLREDLATVARITPRIRTYGMGGTGVILPALCEEAGVKCWPGAWLGRDRAANDQECELLLHAAQHHPDAVETVVVGNEVLLRGDLGLDALKLRLDSVRARLQAADLDIPVGTAEPWHVWLGQPALAESVDVAIVHVHPYWDGLDVASAAAFTMRKLAEVRAKFPDTTVVLGETGWPVAGDTKGAAVPGPDHAARFLAELLPLLRAQDEPFFWFEMWDEAWKAGDEGTVGPHWGLFQSDGSIKPELAAALPGLEAATSERPPRETAPLGR